MQLAAEIFEAVSQYRQPVVEPFRVARWGLRVSDAKRGAERWLLIVTDERQSLWPEPPGAQAVRGRTLRRRALGSSGFRREERSGAMVFHRDRRTTKSVARRPLRPTGYGGIEPSATLPLLDRWGTSTSSRRLTYGPMALVTRSRRVLPRTAMGYGGIEPSATLPLLDRWRTSTSSRCLAYDPMALVTRSLKGSTTGCYTRRLR